MSGPWHRAAARHPGVGSELSFCPELARLYGSDFAEGLDGSRFALGGCSTPSNLVMLKRVFEKQRPRRTLEVGLALGGSCLLFTALHRRIGATPTRQHLAIDPFQRSVWKEAGLLAVQRAGLGDYLEFRESRSSLELAALARQGQNFDLIYIDGSHLFEDVFVDFYFTARLLAQGGIVAFDDCAKQSVKKVLVFIRRNLGASFGEMDPSPFRPDRALALRYRAARLLGKAQMRMFQRLGSVEREWDSPFRNF